MVLVKESVWIHEMSILTSKLRCTFIHHLNKFGAVTLTHFFSKSKGNFICRFKHKGIKTLFKCNLFTLLKTYAAASRLNAVDSLVGHGHNLVHVYAALKSHKDGHHLGGTGRVCFVKCILLIEYASCFGVHDYCLL